MIKPARRQGRRVSRSEQMKRDRITRDAYSDEILLTNNHYNSSRQFKRVKASVSAKWQLSKKLLSWKLQQQSDLTLARVRQARTRGLHVAQPRPALCRVSSPRPQINPWLTAVTAAACPASRTELNRPSPTSMATGLNASADEGDNVGHSCFLLSLNISS